MASLLHSFQLNLLLKINNNMITDKFIRYSFDKAAKEVFQLRKTNSIEELEIKCEKEDLAIGQLVN
jgi:hypothetical protein